MHTQQEIELIIESNTNWIKEHCTCGKCTSKGGKFPTVLCGSLECKKKDLSTRYTDDKSYEHSAWDSLGFSCSICNRNEVEANSKLILYWDEISGKLWPICSACYYNRDGVHKLFKKANSNKFPRACCICNKITGTIYKHSDDKEYCSRCHYYKSTGHNQKSAQKPSEKFLRSLAAANGGTR
jgi:hypothetical protein